MLLLQLVSHPSASIYLTALSFVAAVQLGMLEPIEEQVAPRFLEEDF